MTRRTSRRSSSRGGRRTLPTLASIAGALALVLVPFGTAANAADGDAQSGETAVAAVAEAAAPESPAQAEPEPAAPEAVPAASDAGELPPAQAPPDEAAPEAASDPAPAAQDAAAADASQEAETVPPAEQVDAAASANVAAAPAPSAPVVQEATRASTSVKFEQKAPDSTTYQTGSINDGLVEGGVVNERVTLTYPQEGTNTLILQYQYTYSGKYAFDWLENFHGSTGLTNIRTSAGEPDADGFVTMVVTFDIAPGTTLAYLYFDAHIASELDYGPGTGAGSINGSPYHVVLVSLNGHTTGSRDNQVKASAFPASHITIVKDVADGEDPQDFGFTIADASDSADFVLDDDSASETPQSVTYYLGALTWTVTEHQVPGWVLDSATCTGATATRNGDSITFTTVDDVDVVCTFTNSMFEYEDLVVTKTATPSYTATYDWGIEKAADRTSYTIAPNGTVEVDYTVTAVKKGVSYTGARVDGVITVANPNDIDVTLTGLADDLGAMSCAVDTSAGMTVPALGEAAFPYTCAFPDGAIPADATNTATVTWNAGDYHGTSGSATGSAQVVWSNAAVEEIGSTATITDSRFDFDPPWTVSVDDPEENLVRVYTLTYPQAGMTLVDGCYTVDNTVTISFADESASDSETIEICELGVNAEVIGESTATHRWEIAKTAIDPTSVNDPDGSHSFGYTVTVVPTGTTYANTRIQGEIMLSALSADQTVDLADALGVAGATCTADATGAATVDVPHDGQAHAYAYTCVFPDGDAPVALEVTTSASIDAFGTIVPLSTTTLAVDDWEVAHVDETLDVFDDLASGTPTAIGTVTIRPNGALLYRVEPGYTARIDNGTVVFTYSVVHEVPIGECETFTNTATGTALDSNSEVEPSSAEVELCAPAALVLAATAESIYTADFDWSILKSASPEVHAVAPGETRTVGYTVTVTEDGVVYSDVRVDGALSLTNPNSEDVAITSFAVRAGDLLCEPPAPAMWPSSIGAGTTLVIPYTCDFGVVDALPDVASVAVDIEYAGAFDAGEASAGTLAPIDWNDAEATILDRTVTISDPLFPWTDPWTITAGDDASGVYSRIYEVEYTGSTDGVCEAHENTASLTDDGIEESASTTVKLCTLTADKTVIGTANARFDWSIDKTVDAPPLVDAEDGSHAFAYSVAVTPGEPIYTDYVIAGEITVTNPEGSVVEIGAIEDFLGLEGAVCTVDAEDPNAIEVAPGQSVVVPYTCTMPDLPAPTTVVNTAAFVRADDEVDVLATATLDRDDWQIAVAQDELEVYDDMAGGEQTLIGTVTVDLDGTLRVDEVDGFAATVDGGTARFDYEVVHEVDPGTCATFVNTATGAHENGTIEDDASVDLCSEVDLAVGVEAGGVYDVEHPWTIDKSVEESVYALEGDARSAVARYRVVATAGDALVDGYEVNGVIEVANTNAWEKRVIASAQFPDGQCAVGGTTVVPANSTVRLPIACVFGADFRADTSGTAEITVNLQWTPLLGEAVVATASSPVAWSIDEETNASVNVVDVFEGAQVDLGRLTIGEDGLSLDRAEGAPGTGVVDGMSAVFDYDVELTLPIGATQAEFTNTALVVGDDDEVLDEDDAVTRVVATPPLLPTTGGTRPAAPPAPPALPRTGATDLALAVLGMGFAGAVLVAANRRMRKG